MEKSTSRCFASPSSRVAPTLLCGGRLLSLERPRVMGIVNVTPDSFYDGGRHAALSDQEAHADHLLTEGADMLDIGGCSTRPGAADVDAEEEWRRVGPIIRSLSRRRPEAILSIDTFRAEVARRAVAEGASIVNDIAGGDLDPDMADTVARLRTPYILSHIQGTPRTMQASPTYPRGVSLEVCDHLARRAQALAEKGVADVIVDPGFGFGKTLEDNYRLLRDLGKMKSLLRRPLLVGVSRKSMIYQALGLTPDEALNGTTVVNTLALAAGADILRVHDVAQAAQAVKLFVLWASGSRVLQGIGNREQGTRHAGLPGM